MRNSQLSNIYGNIVSKPVNSRLYTNVLFEKDEKLKKYTNLDLE